MKKPSKRLIIFTDLDGSLLDHETYSYAQAKPALEILKSFNVPLILASSKTAAEVAPLQEELGFSHCPAIVENGSGIIGPENSEQVTTSSYENILKVLDCVPANLRKKFEGFSDLGPLKVAEITGLTMQESKNACNRQFSEPGLWSGSKSKWLSFVECLAESGIIAQQGGRFRTLSFGGNKAERVIEICNAEKKQSPYLFSIALGDASNDIEMLEAVDLGYIIPNNTHSGIAPLKGEKSGKIIRVKQEGPSGWNEAMMTFLNKQESGQ